MWVWPMHFISSVELVGRLVPADYSAPVELPSLAEREGRQFDHPPAL